MASPARRTRGISLVEILVGVGILIVIVAVFWVPLSRMRHGADAIKDASDITMTHKAMLLHAHGGRGFLPLPSRAKGAEMGDPALDTTANLLSLMLADHLITPQMLISRSECNPMVEECTYDYAAVNAATGVRWAPSVRTELDKEDGVCHTSYAHLALCGKRANHWRNVTDSTVPLYGDRGTWRGATAGDAWTNSYTVGRGNSSAWQGNIVFADNHTEWLRTFLPNNVAFSCSAAALMGDNVFDCEFAGAECTSGVLDGRVAGDIWLCITDHFEGTHQLAVDVKERLRDGSLPK